MTRLIINIALASQTDPEVWWRQDYRTIVTAAAMLSEANNNTDDGGRMMSG